MSNIKVKDLNNTTTITTSNQLMVLTDDANNIVQNITVGNFNQNIISTDADNGITQGADGNLYVDNANTGVTAGTYQYPQNLVVDEKGKITSVQSGSPASVPIATTSQAGIVKPDGTTIGVQNDGTISVTGGVLPSQTGNAGKVLTTDGTDASWGATAQVYPVVETYSNGNSWYIVFAPDSNGKCFCIQGSLYYKGTTIAGDNTVAFLKEFADTNYTFLALPAHSSANVTANTFAEKYASRTTSQTILYSPGALFGYQWVAYGYVSMGS